MVMLEWLNYSHPALTPLTTEDLLSRSISLPQHNLLHMYDVLYICAYVQCNVSVGATTTKGATCQQTRKIANDALKI